MSILIKDMEMPESVPDTNVGDMISRQEVIDVLDTGCELLRRVLDDTDVVGVERAKYEWGLSLIESYIADMKALPSAQPEKDWIPVTKKAHPDLPIRVQVQMDNGWIITAYYQEGEWLSVPDCGEPLQDPWVEAWRELPEPYKERREE